ncbi:NAD(P)-dependent alcohol dehydrogenase [Pontibacter oryzae]|uniref:NAD(P)-dependent alcohol dehydrogenase n=1 Tax=Pontibacter oryzae TaxID=2304593 RepID=A0A399SGN0_9BACT|nr:NAD(P)-dependent alcohol dehydrogenase [Pontibacter oryzae]RIJ42368.1 NAD(P)-dependent alcohol dehydrogenase [Pontibacter oryzae]
MIQSKGYAVKEASAPLGDFSFERREVGAKDVLIDILYCGVCHSDLHQVRNEWGNSIYPMVPGHEIVGRVKQVGSHVSRFKEGDLAGIGCFVDSCRHCRSCEDGLEQYCENNLVMTYNGYDKDGSLTYGGYSNKIVVDEKYTLKVPENLELSHVAPLLCAGITTYSPIMEWKIGQGHRVGIVGLGGLGHMAVKIAASRGADVTVLSTSPGKEQDARDLGAHNFAITKNEETMKELAETFDFIIDTVSAPHDYNMYLNLLKRDGTMILLGAPPAPAEVMAANLLFKRRRLVGSLIGGIQETQEMLDYCAEHNIVSDVEVIPMDYINEAYERMEKGDVKYRFVIDMSTL